MLIKRQRLVTCRGCKKTHLIYEYVGLEDGWYSDHYCEEGVELLFKMESTALANPSDEATPPNL